jgi:hypothetical protein
MANSEERRGAFRDYGAGVGMGAAGGSVGALALLNRGRTRESVYGGATNKKTGKPTKRPNRFNRFVDKHTATGTDRGAIARNQAKVAKLDQPNTRNLHGDTIKKSQNITRRAAKRVKGTHRKVLGYGVLGGVALGGAAAAAYREMKKRREGSSKKKAPTKSVGNVDFKKDGSQYYKGKMITDKRGRTGRWMNNG